MTYTDKYYKCPNCDKYYARKWALLSGHMKLRHGLEISTEQAMAPFQISENEYNSRPGQKTNEVILTGPQPHQRIVPQLADAIIEQDWGKVKAVYRVLRDIF